MIPKADRDADKAILAAATGGTWITASPRSQEGSANLATFGPAVTPLPTMAAVVLRVAESGAAPLSEEQHAANAKAAAHAVNRLPAYIEAAAEMEAALSALVDALPTCWVHVLRTDRIYAQCDNIATCTGSDGEREADLCSEHESVCHPARVRWHAHADALLAAAALLRGGK